MTKDKREFRKRITAFFSVFLCLLLVGCQTSAAGQKEQITTESEENEELSDEVGKMQTEDIVIGIDRPTVSSNIAIDLQGYAPDDLKYAYLREQICRILFLCTGRRISRLFIREVYNRPVKREKPGEIFGTDRTGKLLHTDSGDRQIVYISDL